MTEEKLKKIYCSWYGKTADLLTKEELQTTIVEMMEEQTHLLAQLNDAQNTNVTFMKDMVNLKFGRPLTP